MSIPDSLILDYFKLATDVPDKELEEFRQGLSHATVNPMTLKKRLAREIVTQLYNQEAATEAEEHFSRVFQRREVPEKITEVLLTEELLNKIRVHSIKGEEPLIEVGRVEPNGRHPEWYLVSMPLLLLETGLVKSRSEARRLIEQGAVDIDDNTVTEVDWKIKRGSIIRVGKRRYIKST